MAGAGEENQPRRWGWTALKKRLADELDVPRDIVMNLPRVVMLGNLQVLVENHRGLVAYEPQRIVLACDGYQLQVVGQELEIGSVDQDQVIITGQIEQLDFLDAGGEQ